MLMFAYGSNLDLAQMRRRCPSAKPVDAATLSGHRLVFAGWSSRWQGAIANVVPSTRQTVQGALYELTREDMASLDVYEGGYRRELVTVRDSSGQKRRAHAYVLDRPLPAGAPSVDYACAIARGYGAWSLRTRALTGAVKRALRGMQIELVH
jgi:gamma-glutamylcyclotransferase